MREQRQRGAWSQSREEKIALDYGIEAGYMKRMIILSCHAQPCIHSVGKFITSLIC